MNKESFLLDSIIAHRGLHDEKRGIIENSMESFMYALDKNYIIELDVHILKDDTIIVFHDDNLERLTGINKRIDSVSYEEIRNLKLKDTNSIIPKLEDVLKLVDGKVPILIEIKNTSNPKIIGEKLIKILEGYKGNVAIQSFSPRVLNWFKKNASHILRGQLSGSMKGENIFRRFVLKNMLLNFWTKPDFISYAVKDLDIEKARMLRKKYILIGWTVKTKENFEQLKNEYDNLICENFI